MSRYLIVAHQTAFSTELQEQVRAIMQADPDAEFGVLVPETEEHITWEGETVNVAQQRAEATQALLYEQTGARVGHATSGISDPLEAIEQELLAHGNYDTLVICTLPVGISRWLRLDLVHQAERRFHLPVIHVVGETQPSRSPTR
jgi:predicted RNase H-like HicB family nuclease